MSTAISIGVATSITAETSRAIISIPEMDDPM
jgi:hypothetical protein